MALSNEQIKEQIADTRQGERGKEVEVNLDAHDLVLSVDDEDDTAGQDKQQ